MIIGKLKIGEELRKASQFWGFIGRFVLENQSIS